jgi:hypothetical protein
MFDARIEHRFDDIGSERYLALAIPAQPPFLGSISPLLVFARKKKAPSCGALETEFATGNNVNWFKATAPAL